MCQWNCLTLSIQFWELTTIMRFLLNKQGQGGWRTDLFCQEYSKRGHQAALLPRSSAKFELKELTAERTLRQHGHFSWNFEKKSNVVIKFSNNETKNWKPLKKYRDNQYSYFSCALYWRGATFIWSWEPWAFPSFRVGAYSRLGA